MKKIAILSLTLLATGAGMSLPGLVRAEDQSAAPSSPTAAPKADNRMGGDMQGMMKMMGNMTKIDGELRSDDANQDRRSEDGISKDRLSRLSSAMQQVSGQLGFTQAPAPLALRAQFDPFRTAQLSIL
jgi:hypothetical protein